MSSGPSDCEGLARALLGDGKSPGAVVRALAERGHDLRTIVQALWVVFDYRGKRRIEEAIFESGVWPQWKGLEGLDDIGK